MRPARLIIAASAFLLACCGEVPEGALTRAGVTTRPCWGEDTMSGATRCALGEAQAAQVRLEQLMAELEPSLGPARMEELREIQRDWMQWRHRHCTWDAAPHAGKTMQPIWYASCVAAETQQRIDALKYHLCEGAGMEGDCEASRRYDP
ncbi:MAG TPA: lysozyme inhibitor LprI family protein [Longimicrobium sp.]|nr:lysozyme inhibitor LprI family protein [Longimicrobium sp.]